MSVRNLQVGQRASLEVTMTEALIDAFAALSGDDNPLHMDSVAATRYGFPRRVAHGVLSLAFVSTLIGTKLPGVGALWRSLRVDWQRPIFPGDTISVDGQVVQVSVSTDSIKVALSASNQHGTEVLRGEACIGLSEELRRELGTPAVCDPTAGPPSAEPTQKGTRPAVLVTGASRGIGREVALEVGKHGHPIAVAYLRGRDEAEAVVTEIRSAGGVAVSVCLDLTDTVNVERLFEAERFVGPLLGLVHAASPPLHNLNLQQLEWQAFDEYFRVYVGGTFQLVKAMAENMKKHGFGRVILLGTSAILGAPPPKMLAYVTAKMALWGFCKGLALEIGPFGATANLVSPGLTMTDLTRDWSPRMQLAEAQRTPMRRLALPSDTASLIRFLLSEDASFITGANLPVTGGAAFS